MKQLKNIIFNEFEREQKIKVVEFYSPNCQHCKKMRDALADVKKENSNISFWECDILSENDIASMDYRTASLAYDSERSSGRRRLTCF